MAKGSSTRIGGAAIIAWLQRNDATVLVGSPHPRDAWHWYLQKNTSTTGTVADLEKKWLAQRIVALGGTVTGTTSADLWDKYLTVKGYTGYIGDKTRSWLDAGTA